MLSAKTSFAFILFTFLTFSLHTSCKKEINDGASTAETNFTPNAIINVAGRVIDEAGKPVQGVQVTGLNKSTLTNTNGEFLLKNVNVYDKAAFIQVKKNGYFTGSRTFVASKGQTHYVEVELMSNISSGTVNGTTGGTTALANGASVILPANGVITKATNMAYTGQVNVAIKWIDPTSDALSRQMPGDLRGINENNAEMGLQSFGMLAVELTSPSGEALQVAPGKKASLKFPVPASIAAAAPATVPLWSFNDSTGLWKYEGTATKVGSNYEAQVSHFSFWNCDAQFPVVDFTATVKDQNGNPIAHAQIRIKRSASTQSTYGFTDTAGVVRGKVPANESLTFEVYTPYGACNTMLHTQNIGPFAAASSINVIVALTSLTTATITGNVINCTAATVTGGLVEMVLGNRTYYSAISTTGTFSFTINLCSATQTATLLAIDSTTNQQSALTTIAIHAGTNAAGTLSACGTSSHQFINYTFKGTTYSFFPPADSLSAVVTLSGASTYITGSSTNSVVYKKIAFIFSGTTTGSTTVTTVNVSAGSSTALLTQGSTLPATITEFGQSGGFIAGSFSGNITEGINTSVPIQCTFRVRRQQ